MNRILSQLSGNGHYGVSVLVHYQIYRGFRTSEFAEGWSNATELTNVRSRVGIDRSLLNYGFADGPLIHLGLLPDQLEEGMESLGKLCRYCRLSNLENPEEDDALTKAILEIAVEPASSGWRVRANLGDPVWKILESEAFQKLDPDGLSMTNRRIARWWQDKANDQVSGQYATIGDSIDGQMLQFMQPRGSEVTVYGARKSTDGFQFACHNTDSAEQVFGHIYALCVVLDQCQAYAANLARRST